MNWTIIIILSLVILISGVSPMRFDCREESIRVMSDFDERRFAGLWFEYAWIVLDFIPVEQNFLDYITDFIPTRDAQGRNVLIRSNNGRFPHDAPTCDFPDTVVMTSTGTVGKYEAISLFPFFGRNVTSTYWIIDTDYQNYALTYGCREVNSAGFCVKQDAWMFTKVPFPDPKYILIMDRLLQRLCITRDQFTVTDHNMECEPGIWGPNPAPASTDEPDYEVDIKDDDNDGDDRVSNRSLAIIIVDLIICVAFVCVLIILLLHCCGCRMVGPNHGPGSNKPGFSNFGQRISTTSNYGSNHYKL